MPGSTSRRDFMKLAGAATVAAGLPGTVPFATQSVLAAPPKRNYKISLAGWSLHRTIGEGEGKVPMLEMPRMTREDFGIEAIELVNNMLASTEPAYLAQFAKNAADHNVKILLIMCDGLGALGGDTEDARREAIANHKKWIDIAADFGCHSIRTNWSGAPREIIEDPLGLRAFILRSVKPFREVCDYGAAKNISVIIENHGGASSYVEAMVQLMTAVDHEGFGTLPDFGNFPEGVDKYLGIDVLMSYAKAVSAKCYDFDDTTGLETVLDYERLMAIVADKHGYDGYVGIEYEGSRQSEPDGILACKALLERLRG